MNSHLINNKKIAEVVEDEKSRRRSRSAGRSLLSGFNGMIIREQNITPDFFDLKTGIAGKILQKFSNYRVRLAIVSDFSSYSITIAPKYINGDSPLKL